MKTLKWRKRVVFYQNMQIPWVPPLRHDFYRSLKVIKVITGPLWTGSYPLNSMTMRSLQGNQCVCVCVYTRGEEGGVVFWGNVAPTLISNSAEEGGIKPLVQSIRRGVILDWNRVWACFWKDSSKFLLWIQFRERQTEPVLLDRAWLGLVVPHSREAAFGWVPREVKKKKGGKFDSRVDDCARNRLLNLLTILIQYKIAVRESVKSR
jgi:hypothetical protein